MIKDKRKVKANAILLGLLAILILIGMILILNPFSKAEEIDETENTETKASSEEDTGQVFSGGAGTAEEPYIISTAKDLQDLAQKVNSYTQDPNGGYYKTKYYELKNDIDFSGETWNPIGYYDSLNYYDCTTKYSFQGKFDGKGYSLKNITYTITDIPNKVGTYGVFGMLWGDDNNKAAITNLIVDNININLNLETSTYYFGIKIGAIAGHLGKESSITNCIVKNSKITVNQSFVLANEKMLAIGGIVGDSSSDSSSNSSGWSDFKITDNYGIKNCFANVDITANDQKWSGDETGTKYSRYCIGGIIGSFCNVNKYPQNSIYKGTITATKAFVGPIFGKGEFVTIARNAYLKLYTATGSRDTSKNTNYYYNTSILNSDINKEKIELNDLFKSEDKKKTEGEKTAYTISKDSKSMGYVQGVNYGEYTNSLTNQLNRLNVLANSNEKYCKWFYDSENDLLSFENKPVVTITNDKYTYRASVSNTETPEDEFEYKWFLNGEEQTKQSSKIITIKPAISDRKLTAKIYLNGICISSSTVNVKKEEINIYLKQREEENSRIIYADLHSPGGYTKNDFEYQWYNKKSEDDQYTKIENAINYEYDITNVNDGEFFKLVVTSKVFENFNKEYEYIDRNVIYVNQAAGNNGNDGLSSEKAVQTLEQAYALLPAEATENANYIVVVGTYNQSFDTEYKKEKSKVFIKPATICGRYQENNYDGKLRVMQTTNLHANTVLQDITLSTYGNTFINAQGNDITLEASVKFDESFNMSDSAANAWGITDIYGYEQLKRLTIVGGTKNYHNNGSTHDEIPDRISNITVRCSGIAVITGGSRTENDITSDVYGSAEKPANVKINIEINSNAELDVGVVVGGQCDSSCYINSEITVENGNIGRVVGGTLGYGNRYEKNIPRDTFYGSTVLNVNGGLIKEIYGGSLGRLEGTSYMYGKVTLNVNGGTIESNIYGAGAGGVLGYSEKSTDSFKDNETYGAKQKQTYKLNDDGSKEYYNLDEAEVNININGGTINGNIYGGGYGESAYLTASKITEDGGTLYGNTNIKITGGTIEGNVYGGGKGTATYGETRSELAKIFGDISIVVSEQAQINGSVYGGSEGIEQYPNIGKVYGTVSIEVFGEDVNITNGSIYGSGNAGAVCGPISIFIESADIKANVYGGGYGQTAVVENGGSISSGKSISSDAQKLINIEIENSKIDGSVFGGGNKGDVYGNVAIGIKNNSNITEAVYGGGNNANIGTKETNANTYVEISNANIGKVSGTNVTGGEVFGGGNLGVVFGNTQIEVGSKNSKIKTTVGNQIYAGGRGNTGVTTVTGSSTGKIIGTNTKVNQYGDSSLGIVQGDVDIHFVSYKRSNVNKYKVMQGINKATNIYLEDSYVYLQGGLVNITNLYIPEKNGMMISEDSEIAGNFTGGGELYLQNNVTLTVNGDLTKESGVTTLTLNPELIQDKGYFEIKGGLENPYIVVRGTDYSNGGVTSGNERKYTIKNNRDSQSSYYIENTIIIAGYATEHIYNQKDKLFTSPINNEDEVYMLENGAFTSKINVDYSMVRSLQDDGTWKFSDLTEMKNLRRYIYITGLEGAIKLPKGTIITMLINDKYYTYKVSENYGTEEFWKSISQDANYLNLEITENLNNEIPVCLFKDDEGNTFKEIYNVQNILEQDTSTSNICSMNEEYRFIFDFSNCENLSEEEIKELTGEHEVVFDIWDYKIDEKLNILQEETYTQRRKSNEVIVDNRNYQLLLNYSKMKISQIEKLSANVNFVMDQISKLNTEDYGKNIRLRIMLFNEAGEVVNIPRGSIIKIDGNPVAIENNEVLYDVITKIDQNQYTKEANLELDMTEVNGKDTLKQGNYYIQVEAYLSEDNAILGNKPLSTEKIEFEYSKQEGYGIKVTAKDENSQIITENADVSKTVNVQFEKGELEDGAYIAVKALRKIDQFDYSPINETLAVEPQITELESGKYESTLVFNKNLLNNTYKIVYELYDKNNVMLTSDSINFIVKR